MSSINKKIHQGGGNLQKARIIKKTKGNSHLLLIPSLLLLVGGGGAQRGHRAVAVAHLTQLLLQQLLVVQLLLVRGQLADQQLGKLLDVLLRVGVDLARLEHQLLLVQVLRRQQLVGVLFELLRLRRSLELLQLLTTLQLLVEQLLRRRRRRRRALRLLHVGERRVVVVSQVAACLKFQK